MEETPAFIFISLYFLVFPNFLNRYQAKKVLDTIKTTHTFPLFGIFKFYVAHVSEQQGSLLGALAVLLFPLEATKHSTKADCVERVHGMGREKGEAWKAGQEGTSGGTDWKAA